MSLADVEKFELKTRIDCEVATTMNQANLKWNILLNWWTDQRSILPEWSRCIHRRWSSERWYTSGLIHQFIFSQREKKIKSIWRHHLMKISLMKKKRTVCVCVLGNKRKGKINHQNKTQLCFWWRWSEEFQSTHEENRRYMCIWNEWS